MAPKAISAGVLYSWWSHPQRKDRTARADQVESDLMGSLPGWGLGVGRVATLPHRNTNCYSNQKRWWWDNTDWGFAAGAAMTLWGQSQPEAQRPIGPQATDDHRLLEREVEELGSSQK